MVFKLFFGNEVTAAGTVEGVGTATGSSTAAAVTSLPKKSLKTIRLSRRGRNAQNEVRPLFR